MGIERKKWEIKYNSSVCRKSILTSLTSVSGIVITQPWHPISAIPRKILERRLFVFLTGTIFSCLKKKKKKKNRGVFYYGYNICAEFQADSLKKKACNTRTYMKAVILIKLQFLPSERYMHIFNMLVTFVHCLKPMFFKKKCGRIWYTTLSFDQVFMIIRNIS